MMTGHCQLAVAALCISLVCVSIGSSTNCCADYPWIYYFARPEMPRIHASFATATGRILISTGDWSNIRDNPGVRIYEYWSEGQYCANNEVIEQIDAPDNTYVIDGAVGGNDSTWLLIGEGADSYQYTMTKGGLGSSRGKSMESDIGYRGWRFPSRGNKVTHPRIACLENGAITIRADIADAIPETPFMMLADGFSRVFVISSKMDENRVIQEFISWWVPGISDEVFNAAMSMFLPLRSGIRDYPCFGPDGTMYMIVTYVTNESSSEVEYVVVSFNPDTMEWHVFDEKESQFIDCEIAHIFIDPMNIMWIGTEDGLVRFDGENWSRFTTENSDLPLDVVVDMAYDQQDDMYYVICQEVWDYGDYDAAFCAFSSSGELRGGPVYFPPPAYSYPKELIFRDSRGIWWLNVRNTGTVYSYDHQGIVQWSVDDWIESSSVGHIGGTSSGQTYAVGGTWLMIW